MTSPQLTSIFSTVVFKHRNTSFLASLRDLIFPNVGGLPNDPRTWGRDEVGQFLQYCEKEFDLEKIDMDRFQMNGKKYERNVCSELIHCCL